MRYPPIKKAEISPCFKSQKASIKKRFTNIAKHTWISRKPPRKPKTKQNFTHRNPRNRMAKKQRFKSKRSSKYGGIPEGERRGKTCAASRKQREEKRRRTDTVPSDVIGEDEIWDLCRKRMMSLHDLFEPTIEHVFLKICNFLEFGFF